MIIHVFVPYPEVASLKEKEGIDFKIIESFTQFKRSKSILIVDTTEEELVFLKLKYGNSNVWKR